MFLCSCYFPITASSIHQLGYFITILYHGNTDFTQLGIFPIFCPFTSPFSLHVKINLFLGLSKGLWAELSAQFFPPHMLPNLLSVSNYFYFRLPASGDLQFIYDWLTNMTLVIWLHMNISAAIIVYSCFQQGAMVLHHFHSFSSEIT